MAKRYKYRNGPNRLLELQAWHLPGEKDLGFVLLETDHGMVEFAINRNVAEMLRDEMQAFLDGKVDELPKD